MTAASCTIQTMTGEEQIKLPAGSIVAYPSSSLHRVTPVTRGVRVAAVTWVQSMVRDPACREILFDLETTRRSIFESQGKTREFDLISKILRQSDADVGGGLAGPPERAMIAGHGHVGTGRGRAHVQLHARIWPRRAERQQGRERGPAPVRRPPLPLASRGGQGAAGAPRRPPAHAGRGPCNRRAASPQPRAQPRGRDRPAGRADPGRRRAAGAAPADAAHGCLPEATAGGQGRRADAQSDEGAPAN